MYTVRVTQHRHRPPAAKPNTADFTVTCNCQALSEDRTSLPDALDVAFMHRDQHGRSYSEVELYDAQTKTTSVVVNDDPARAREQL